MFAAAQKLTIFILITLSTLMVSCDEAKPRPAPTAKASPVAIPSETHMPLADFSGVWTTWLEDVPFEMTITTSNQSLRIDSTFEEGGCTTSGFISSSGASATIVSECPSGGGGKGPIHIFPGNPNQFVGVLMHDGNNLAFCGAKLGEQRPDPCKYPFIR